MSPVTEERKRLRFQFDNNHFSLARPGGRDLSELESAEVERTAASLVVEFGASVGQTDASWRIVVTRGGVFNLGRKTDFSELAVEWDTSVPNCIMAKCGMTN